jgi:hypothetical protein
MPTPPPEVMQDFQRINTEIILYAIGFATLLLIPIGLLALIRQILSKVRRPPNYTPPPLDMSSPPQVASRSSTPPALPGDLLKLTPRQFEEMVLQMYRWRGHRAQRTGRVGDHGVDIVVHARNGEKWVIQCKRWRGSVGEPTVRDFYGTMQHEKADKGAIITTGTFTSQAHTWARGKPIHLFDGSTFTRLWREAQAQSPQSTI